MLFTHIYIDNFFGFHQTSLDLTYSRPIKNSTIAHEYLSGRQKFYIKKVCILSGANASGKTSLGKVLAFVHNFIAANQPMALNIRENIYYKEKPATIYVEFATPKQHYLHRLQLVFLSNSNNITFNYAHVPIGINDSVGKTRKRLDKLLQNKEGISNGYYLEEYNTEYFLAFTKIYKILEPYTEFGWLYIFSNNDDTLQKSIGETFNIDIKVLRSVLQTFDDSIVDVSKFFNEGLLSYQIKFGNGDYILMDTKASITNPTRLSKGTYDALVLSVFISRVMSDAKHSKQGSDTYYLDEKMAFVHSELEQAILNLIIDKLHPNSQLFYTTHNCDILEMNLPIHSFVFLKKEQSKVSFIQAESEFKKNDRSLLSFVKNDVLRTLPDTSAIDELLFDGE